MDKSFFSENSQKNCLFFCLCILCWITLTNCGKKDEQANKKPTENPAEVSNGWEYWGSHDKLSTLNPPIGLALHKVYLHGNEAIDVFFNTKIPYYENSIYMTDFRWLLDLQGNTIRLSSNEDFSPDAWDRKLSISLSKEAPSGYGEIPDFWLPSADIEVFGTGYGEFTSYNIKKLAGGSVFGLEISFHKSVSAFIKSDIFGFSSSPRSVVSSPYSYIYPDEYVIKSQSFWNGRNIAVGTRGNIKESFIISTYNDYDTKTLYLQVHALTPKAAYNASDKAWFRGTVFLFSKKISEVIPQLNLELPLLLTPHYFQYPGRPNVSYFLIQNLEQLFLVSFNMETLSFKLCASYNLNELSDYPRSQYNFKWIEDDPESFLYTGENGKFFKAILFKNGSAKNVEFPVFRSYAQTGVVDLNYDSGKLWLILYDKKSKIHLFSKNY